MFHLPLAGDGGVAPDTTLGKADQPIEVEPIGKAVTAVLLDLLPWGLAVLLHAAVILLSIFVAWQAGPAQAKSTSGADAGEVVLAPAAAAAGRKRSATRPNTPAPGPTPKTKPWCSTARSAPIPPTRPSGGR